MSDEHDLSAGEERFVEEYLIDRNGSRAYRRANPGVRADTAAQAASRLLTRRKVRAAVARESAALARRTGVTPARVVAALARIAFADIGGTFDLGQEGFRPLSPREIPYELRTALQAVRHKKKVVRRGETEVAEECVEYRLPDRV
ncbi:MAG: terminase small subunit, partial [Gemmataceae bacterium]|nr:terminase small subunit [Gemmataceae bacterium]